MLIGVGCDLIEIERVKKACDKEAFLSRIYTERERRQAKGDPRVLAGTFAVKEAVAKVFGTGFREFMPQDSCCPKQQTSCNSEINIKKNVPWHILAPRAVACDNLHLRTSAHPWHVSVF